MEIDRLSDVRSIPKIYVLCEKKFIAKPVVVVETVIDRFVEKPVSVPDDKFTIIYQNSIPVSETKAPEKSAKSKTKHRDKAVSVKPLS